MKKLLIILLILIVSCSKSPVLPATPEEKIAEPVRKDTIIVTIIQQ